MGQHWLTHFSCFGCSLTTWVGGPQSGRAYTVSGTSKTGEVRYRAFGATRFTSGTTPTTYRYTGQREEVNFGLYYYGARWYDPALGRFVQADTLVPGPGDPQAYDRYAYVNNNPLKYTDPSGRCKTLKDGSRDEGDAECWGLADQIYHIYDTNTCPVGCLGAISWGRSKWNIDRDVWMAAYAGAWDHDATKMETWLDEYNAMFGQTRGIVPPTVTGGEWRHPLQNMPNIYTIQEDGLCGVWDCVAIGLDISAILARTYRDSSLLSAPVTGPVGILGATYGEALENAASVAGVLRTAHQVQQGKAGRVDLAVSGISYAGGKIPIAGPIFGVLQLLYNLTDPFTPW